MSWLSDKLGHGPLLPEGSQAFFARRMSEISGGALVILSGAYMGALSSYKSTDASLNASSSAPVQNFMGGQGAMVSDIAIQGFGLAAVLPALTLMAWGVLLMRKLGVRHLWLCATLMIVAPILASMTFAALPPFTNWPLAVGLGGVSGAILLERLAELLALFGIADLKLNALIAAVGVAFPALIAWVMSFGLPTSDWQRMGYGLAYINHRLGHFILTTLLRLKSRKAVEEDEDDELDDLVVTPAGATATAKPKRKKVTAKKTKTKAVVEDSAKPVKQGRKAAAERQRSLDLGTDNEYVLPPLDILDAPDPNRTTQMSKEALEQNAAMLASVLEDFGVKGEIVKVRPGPVVTLYELEPAPGTKTSRVIGLSDDIARSMSAVSVRVATVPGRNVIGIEMPNQSREMVHLHELIASQDFEKAKGGLNLALGKDIGGHPVIVDLARMPHLLVSGTTGSGKSVGVNAMICSLLYQYSPDQCRFIMIDPKMLELSVYDGIPHLLSPVVTDPGKAVVALKWAVKEMEDRYRLMSQMGVRNITGYNQRLADAAKKGEELTRRVQTGFDEDGKPVHEDQPLSMDPLPYIVVIVDEMADLMLVAGKDVEAAIQRLAQMARAAGIHLIMATQRPSVDVITGTIKANFPTRISFQVTSKIDSRTILGEQGAEQLLGQGDMLYMAGGGRITRVHAPFVADEEVEDVVLHLKDQGVPAYIESVTEEQEPEPGALPVAGGGTKDDALYDQAVALVAREGKASTSFVQRHLQIGYNRAARIIERMEAEGVVSKANRVGRREVLIGDVSAA